MLDADPSSSGTSLLGDKSTAAESPVVWFQDVLAADPSVAERKEKWELPKSSWLHKLVMLLVVAIPMAGLVGVIALSWQYGFMGWLYLGMLIGGWILTGLGITIGYHRLLAHRAFETYGPIRTFWMFLGALSVEGSPLEWSATHRRHHEVSDQPGDPHSPYQFGREMRELFRGFWHAHSGWLFTGNWSGCDRSRYIPDLVNDRAMQVVDRNYYLFVGLSLLIPAAIGGLAAGTWQGAWLGLLWGGLARISVTHHITWSVNSVCHMFGSREFESYDESRNNALFGVLALGEGWHNNHHAFPTSARHGLRWWQFDLSWVIIRTMQLCGLAWNVKLPNPRFLKSRALAAR
jgi:stearoyl-CoA desaturase (delta-9 desaturase)